MGIPPSSTIASLLLFTVDLPTSDKVLTSTFADDTAMLSPYKNPVISSVELNNHSKRIEMWFNNWTIRVNDLRSKHITFTLRKGDCPPVLTLY